MYIYMDKKNTDGIANFKSFSEEAIVNLQKESVAGDNVYADSTNGYYFNYPSTWKLTKRDKIPQASGQYAVERVMVVGNNFAEGSSLSVTRTAPTRLLKDFGTYVCIFVDISLVCEYGFLLCTAVTVTIAIH